MPHYNFAEIPEVHARDAWWHRKYAEDREGRAIPVPAGAAGEARMDRPSAPHGVELPDPSYWPMVVAFGIFILCYGVVFMRPDGPTGGWSGVAIGACLTGFVTMLTGIFGWVLEPLEEHHGSEAHA